MITGRQTSYRPYVVESVGRCSWNKNAIHMHSTHRNPDHARNAALKHRDNWHSFWPVTLLFWTWRVRDSRDGTILFEVN